MNEITSALKVVNTAVKTVRIIDFVKKIIVASAAMLCCVFAIKLWRK